MKISGIFEYKAPITHNIEDWREYIINVGCDIPNSSYLRIENFDAALQEMINHFKNKQ